MEAETLIKITTDGTDKEDEKFKYEAMFMAWEHPHQLEVRDMWVVGKDIHNMIKFLGGSYIFRGMANELNFTIGLMLREEN